MELRKLPFWTVALSLLILPIPLYALAVHDRAAQNSDPQSLTHYEAHQRERHRERSHAHGASEILPPGDTGYKENCGACHFSYQPGLLPIESWRKILAGLDDHFGQSLAFDPQTKKGIANCLESNAADRSKTKCSVRIMRSLGAQAPMRITEIPYIKRKHSKISPAVLDRPSIGSLANCTACHTRAGEGVYDHDDVMIPE